MQAIGRWAEGQAGQKGSDQGGPGQAAGGQGRRAPDDGAPMTEDRVRGQLDPEGRLGRPTKFEGIPRPTEAKLRFDEALQRARSAAEESLSREALPPGARPYVRRYFEPKTDEKR